MIKRYRVRVHFCRGYTNKYECTKYRITDTHLEMRTLNEAGKVVAHIFAALSNIYVIEVDRHEDV